MSSTSAPSLSAPSTPRILKSPRAAPKESTRISEYFNKVFCSLDNVPFDVLARRMGKRVINAFNTGQPCCFLRIAYLGRHYQKETVLTHFNSSAMITGPVLDRFTFEPFLQYGTTPICYTIMSSLLPTIQWIQQQGLDYRFVTEKVGQDMMGDPIVADWCLLIVHISGNSTVPNKDGYLSSLWNNVITAKCLDSSLLGQWRQRVISSINCGQYRPCVLMKLYYGSDYSYKKDATGPLVCSKPVHWFSGKQIATTALGHGLPVLDARFSHVVRWTEIQGCSWGLALCNDQDASGVDDDATAEWAFFTVQVVITQ